MTDSLRPRGVFFRKSLSTRLMFAPVGRIFSKSLLAGLRVTVRGKYFSRNV